MEELSNVGQGDWSLYLMALYIFGSPPIFLIGYFFV